MSESVFGKLEKAAAWRAEDHSKIRAISGSMSTWESEVRAVSSVYEPHVQHLIDTLEAIARGRLLQAHMAAKAYQALVSWRSAVGGDQ